MRIYPNIYNQRDPRWGGQELGTGGGVTIHDDGCYLTSFAMKAGYYGHTIAPDALNQFFISHGLYSQGDLISNDDQLHDVYSDVVFKEADPYLDPHPADLAKLKQLSDDDTLTVTLEIERDNVPGKNHFVELQSYDGSTLLVVDPWYGEVLDFAQYYGDPATRIVKFVVYKGTPPVTSVSFVATPVHTPLGFFADAGFTRHLYDSAAAQGTPIRFDAWLHGVGVTDPVTGQIDRRWYRRFNPGGQAGWTPSAWVTGDAPNSTP